MTWHRMDDPDNPPPKDGREIQLYFPNHLEDKVGAYYFLEEWTGYPTWEGNFGYCPIVEGSENQPTHWAPLLAPPEGEE